jgi:cation transport ATPase
VVDDVTRKPHVSRDDEAHLMDRLLLTVGAAVPTFLAVAIGSSIPDCGREAYALHVVGWFLFVLLVAGGSAFLTGLVVGLRSGASAMTWASIACATAAAAAVGFMLGPVLGGCGPWWDAVAFGFIFVLVTALVAGGASLALSTAIRRRLDVEPRVDKG